MLTLARRVNARAVIDDGEARSAARVLGVPTIGTLGVILLCRKAGLIGSAGEVLRAIRGVGFHIDDRVLRDALPRTVGESWDA